jgi:hypothetical protein
MTAKILFISASAWPLCALSRHALSFRSVYCRALLVLGLLRCWDQLRHHIVCCVRRSTANSEERQRHQLGLLCEALGCELVRILAEFPGMLLCLPVFELIQGCPAAANQICAHVSKRGAFRDC